MQTLIFDFDGTICDSYLESLRMMNELAPEFGFNVVPESEFESLKDQGTGELLALLGVAVHKIPAILIQGRKRMRARAADLKPIDGLPDALRDLHKHGFGLGILTSNSRENVELFLQRNQLGIFEFVHGESSMLGKARILKKIMKQRGLKPAQVAYVGDEVRDVKAAHSAKVAALAVTWGFNSVRLLREAQPSIIFSQPAQLVEHALLRRGLPG